MDKFKNYHITTKELEHLISPTKINSFKSNIFGQKPFLSLNKGPIFKEIIDYEGIRDVLLKSKVLPNSVTIHANHQKGLQSKNESSFEINVSAIDKHLESGTNICITSLHLLHPKLNSYVRALKHQLNFAGGVGVNCYISPIGHGFNVHFDNKNVTAVQLEGQKEWHYSHEQAIIAPQTSIEIRNNKLYFGKKKRTSIRDWEIPSSPNIEQFSNTVLNPGDVLFLPSGTWHTAAAIEFSVSLNIYFQPRNFFDLISPLLEERFNSKASWRSTYFPDLDSDYINDEFDKRLSEFEQEIKQLKNKKSEIIKNYKTLCVSGENTLETNSDQSDLVNIQSTEIFFTINMSKPSEFISHSNSKYFLIFGEAEVELSKFGKSIYDTIKNNKNFNYEDIVESLNLEGDKLTDLLVVLSTLIKQNILKIRHK